MCISSNAFHEFHITHGEHLRYQWLLSFVYFEFSNCCFQRTARRRETCIRSITRESALSCSLLLIGDTTGRRMIDVEDLRDRNGACRRHVARGCRWIAATWPGRSGCSTVAAAELPFELPTDTQLGDDVPDRFDSVEIQLLITRLLFHVVIRRTTSDKFTTLFYDVLSRSYLYHNTIVWNGTRYRPNGT